MKIYAGRDFLGRAYMCPSLGTEDRVMRYQILTGSPGGPALGWPVLLGICTIQSGERDNLAIAHQRPE